MEIRALTPAEQKYTYAQSMQLEGQTGSIGYLRGDFGAGGKEFYSSWFDRRRDLKTDDFKNCRFVKHIGQGTREEKAN